VQKPESKDDVLSSLYRIYREAHFEGVWKDAENTVQWNDSDLSILWGGTLNTVSPEEHDRTVPKELQILHDDLMKSKTNGSSELHH